MSITNQELIKLINNPEDGDAGIMRLLKPSEEGDARRLIDIFKNSEVEVSTFIEILPELTENGKERLLLRLIRP